MPGETIKTLAICLRIVPWSKTSHVVTWLTLNGIVSTVVKGAVRAKSAFLGQYDLNYTCEIIYYTRERKELHVLRECSPLSLRDSLRDDYRRLIAAEYLRVLSTNLAATGDEGTLWYKLLDKQLDNLSNLPTNASNTSILKEILDFELKSLNLSGLSPEIEAEKGSFSLRGERNLPVNIMVANAIKDIRSEKNTQIILDSARVIGVFYLLHLDCASDLRRNTINLILNSKKGEENKK